MYIDSFSLEGAWGVWKMPEESRHNQQTLKFQLSSMLNTLAPHWKELDLEVCIWTGILQAILEVMAVGFFCMFMIDRGQRKVTFINIFDIALSNAFTMFIYLSSVHV